MATYSLCQDFPTLLRDHPKLVLRELALSLAGARDKDHAQANPSPKTMALNGVYYGFDHDMSYIWAWDTDTDTDTHDDIAKLYQATMSWFASANGPSLARRGKLIDCVAVFVEAGWPEARRLFQSLPELLQ